MNPWLFGTKSDSDWYAHLQKLQQAPAVQSLWDEAFEKFYMERLKTRYFESIQKISGTAKGCNDCTVVACEEHKPILYTGAGFAIVAIQCSLIEFFHTTIIGCNFARKAIAGNYADLAAGRTNYEYSTGLSKDIFSTFLSTEDPFKKFFPNIDEANEFYWYVRCPVLHEARTSNNWRIRPGERSSAHVIEKDSSGDVFLYWRSFQFAIMEFLTEYKQRLRTDSNIQEAFKRKLNGLCV